MEELLFVTSDSLKAQLVTEALKEQGIPCYRKDLGAGQFLNIYFGMFTNSGIEIYVPSSALEAAREVLEGIGLAEYNEMNETQGG